MKAVLGEAAGVAEVAGFGFPVLEAAVVVELQILCQDEGDDAVSQTLLEQQEAADAAVTVLERVDALESVVEVQQIVEGLALLRIVIPQKPLHGCWDLLRGGGGPAAHLVGEALIIPHGEPVLAAVGGSVFQHGVELLDQALAGGVVGCVDDQVDAAEMVRGLHHVVHAHGAVHADGVRLKDQPGLIVGQAAALDVVGVVGQVDLDAVIQTALQPCGLFFPQYGQHVPLRVRTAGLPRRLFGILRHVPGFSGQQRPGNASLGAVIPHAALREPPALCRLRNRNIVHHATLRNEVSGNIIPHYRQNSNSLFE